MSDTLQEEIEESSDPHRGPEDHRVDDPDADDPSGSAFRRLPILRRDLQAHKFTLRSEGFAEDCPKCKCLKDRQFLRARSHNHSESCRARLYECLRLAKDPRIVTADARGGDRTRIQAKQKEDPNVQDGPKQHEPNTPREPSAMDAAPSTPNMDMYWQDIFDEPLSAETGVEIEDTSFLYGDLGPDAADPDDAENLFGPQSPAPFTPDVDHDDASMDVQFDHQDMVDTISAITDVLQTLGVDPAIATRYASSIRKKTKPTLVEVFGVGNIMRTANEGANDFNIEGLAALDLRSKKPNGQAWDFRKRSDRRQAYRLIKEKKPTWVIGMPPCTPFSTWNAGVNRDRMDPIKRSEALREGRAHLKFVLSLYSLQIRDGRFFLHEHPQGASSWREPMLEKLLGHPSVGTVCCDQCSYGLYSKTPDGEWMLSKKPTRWASNSTAMLDRLSKRCTKDHPHQWLDGGRTKKAV